MNAQVPPRSIRLEPCLEKIARAREHIAETQRRVDQWRALIPVRVVCRRDAATRRMHYLVDSVAPAPAGLPLVIGDAVHNARSALDHAAYQLFLANGGRIADAKHIAFPIAPVAADYPGLADRKLAGISQAARAAVDALRPFGGGEDRLSQLGALDNADKHRLLLVVAAQFRSANIVGGHVKHVWTEMMTKHFPDVQLKFPALFIKPADPMWPLKPGDLLFDDAPDAAADPAMEFRFELAFSDTTVCDGIDVLEKLNQLISFAESVVLGLAPHL
jgi:hypothetical protein